MDSLTDEDVELLMGWCYMEKALEYMERRGAFQNTSGHDKAFELEKAYYNELSRRITYCQALLKNHDDAIIYFTLAQLERRNNIGISTKRILRKEVRWYAIQALRRDRKFHKAWALLSESYADVALVANEAFRREDAPQAACYRRSIQFIERAILCLKKALDLDPDNEDYDIRLKRYYAYRNEEFGPEGSDRYSWESECG